MKKQIKFGKLKPGKHFLFHRCLFVKSSATHWVTNIRTGKREYFELGYHWLITPVKVIIRHKF